jgi:hypothetical protein
MKYRGYARVGLVRIGPFATLSFETDSIRISGFGLSCVLKKSEVKRLEYGGSFFSEGVRITHSNPSVDAYVVFSPFRPMRFLAAAKSLGYSTISAKNA